ncbi:3'-5' exonuclease [Chitinimonas koreensis]|uniref:3'-5' exonuclease n=1 Tax=Chitinimonas koreensis TaxID=356302 RepID=UPI000411EA12|nr:3'-5' exonuclease [Chitinimonas koreensis]QNM94924.1 3'-5' exoribonuclease [Chitinimonas koreensis]
MSRHIVLDIETLDTVATARILSAAMLWVDVDHGEVDVIKSMTLSIATDSQPDRTASAATRDWWGKQPLEARHAAFAAKSPIPLQNAVRMIAQQLEADPAPIWGNGSDFDNATLAHAFAQQGLEWPFRLNRCLRTLRATVDALRPGFRPPVRPPELIPHIAQYDARYEATCLAALLHALD